MYSKGNVFSENERHGWIYGHFMPEGLSRDSRVEIKVVQLDKSFSSPPHYAKIGTKLDIIWEGDAIWIVDDKEIEMHAGDYVIIPPKVTVGVKKVLSDKIIVQTIKIPSIPDDKITV
jgi:quercetin dioxygenase-like cupin family protein